MTQTIKCDVCGKVEDSVKAAEAGMREQMMQMQMQAEAEAYGMSYEPQITGWCKIFDADLCRVCLAKYREQSTPLKAELEAKLKAIIETMTADHPTLESVH